MKKTKYQLIADEIRTKILSGELKVNDVIRPELQLQKDYQVSRHTVREAIALLVNEGFLRKEKGSGTYVSDSYQNQTAGNTGKKTIGVITTYLSDYIFPAIIRGIEKELSQNNYSLLLASTNNNLEQERKSLEMMLNHGVDGLIIEPTKSNQFNPNIAYYLTLKEQQIPYVMINASYEELDAPCIYLDDVQAGYLVTSELLNKGHEHIALITKTDDLQGKNRMKGFVKAFEEKGKVFKPEAVFTYTTESRLEMLSNLKKSVSTQTPQITGIVCYNDEIAIEVISLAQELGISVPTELSVVGQDDSLLSTTSEVKLTTSTHPKEKMGEDAANWIIKKVEGKKNVPKEIKYEPQLIKRNSVKKYQ